MVEQGSGRSALPEIFDAMLYTLLLQGRLFTDQTGRTVWTRCYLMGVKYDLWAGCNVQRS